jgi:hypothetical protein
VLVRKEENSNSDDLHGQQAPLEKQFRSCFDPVRIGSGEHAMPTPSGSRRRWLLIHPVMSRIPHLGVDAARDDAETIWAFPRLIPRTKDLLVQGQGPYHAWYHHLFRVHNDAAADLRAIKVIDADAFARLVAFIQELRADDELQKHLLDHGHEDAEISVKKWGSVYRMAPIWRLRSYSLEGAGINYRLIYVNNWKDAGGPCHYLMAVVAKAKFDYDDPNDSTRQRVLSSCRRDFGAL